MSIDTAKREELAEALSWSSGEFTRYSETAVADHNRWSWRGDGHGEVLRQQFYDQADALAPLIARWIAEARAEGAAEGWERGYRERSRCAAGRHHNPYRAALTPPTSPSSPP